MPEYGFTSLKYKVFLPIIKVIRMICSVLCCISIFLCVMGGSLYIGILANGGRTKYYSLDIFLRFALGSMMAAFILFIVLSILCRCENRLSPVMEQEI